MKNDIIIIDLHVPERPVGLGKALLGGCLFGIAVYGLIWLTFWGGAL